MEDKKGTNAVAIVGFVFSMLSVVTLGFLSSVGLVLSIIGCAISKNYKKGLKGLAIAGIVVSSVFFVLFWILVITANTDESSKSTPTYSEARKSNNKKGSKDIKMFDFSTMTRYEASKKCEEVNLICVFDSNYSDEVESGKLISQSVPASEIVKEGSTVTVIYSAGHKKTPEELEAERVEKERQEAERKRQEEERKRQELEAIKNSYESVSYEQLARNPESVKGKKIQVKGEVLQVTDDGLLVQITYNGYYYTDSIFVVYSQKTGDDKILEDDVINVYGIADGEYSYYTVLGAKQTIPKVKSEIVELAR